MARISEIHYSDAVEANTGTSEFVEVALGAGEDPNDFLISLYEADGSVGLQVSLNDPLISTFIDEDSGEQVFVISSDDFNYSLSDATSGDADNFEAVALTNTDTDETLDFYDIGGGGNVVASDGAAAGETSETVSGVDESNDESVQFNNPNPDTQRNRELSEGESSNCFTPKTLIMTPDGERAAGDLKVGDLVLTVDRGAQPIRYVYRRSFRAIGAARPVLFVKGSVGNTSDLLVSQAHRLLVTKKANSADPRTSELVNAIMMVNGGTVRLLNDLEEVEYIHLMLDQHELLWSAGVATESWQPHRRNLRRFDKVVREELLTFFPEIRHHNGHSIDKGGPVRRPCAPDWRPGAAQPSNV